MFGIGISDQIVFGMFGIGTPELLIVGVVVLLLFGNRLPGVMRSLGKGIVEFKKGVNDIEDDVSRIDSDSKDDDQS